MKFSINMGDGVAFDITGKDVLRTAMKMSDAYPGETIMVFAMDVCRLQVLDGKVIEDQADIHPFHDLSHYSPAVQVAIEVQWRNMLTAPIRAKYKLTDLHGARGVMLPVSMAEWDDLYNELSLKFPVGCDIANVIIGHDNEVLVARPDGGPGQFVMAMPANYYDGCRRLDWTAITGATPKDGGIHDASVTINEELSKQRPVTDSAIPINWDFLDKAPMLMTPKGNHHPIGVHTDESTDMSFGLGKLAGYLNQPPGGHIDIEDRELRNPPTVAGEHYEGEFIDGANSGERLHADMKKAMNSGGPLFVLDSLSPIVDDIPGTSKVVEEYTATERREMGLPDQLTGEYNKGHPNYVPPEKDKE